MKAIVFERYGPPDVLRLCEVEKPVPGDDEVLIRIHAASVMAGDCEVRSFTFPLWLWLPLRIMFGLIRPRIRILGQELAGEIEAVGRNVRNFRTGDQVFATAIHFGAHAQYLSMSSDGPLAIKPANMSYEEATTVPTGGYNSLHFLRKADIQPGQKVLVNGAAGSIGTIAIQLARHFGAEVTGVDSTAKLETLRTIGAHHVVDYTKEDFTRRGETYDVILDVVGKSPYARSIRCLTKNGVYLLANPPLSSMLRGIWTTMTSDKRVVSSWAGASAEDLDYLRELIEAGEIVAVVDRVYSMEQVVEAHSYVEQDRRKGSVVLSIGRSD